MGIINYTVYCRTARRVIVPWKITAVGQPSFTFRHFFDAVVKSQCTASTSTTSNPPECLLSEVYIGKAKESLDHVDPDLIIEEVVPVFRPFVKFAVEEIKRR